MRVKLFVESVGLKIDVICDEVHVAVAVEIVDALKQISTKAEIGEYDIGHKPVRIQIPVNGSISGLLEYLVDGACSALVEADGKNSRSLNDHHFFLVVAVRRQIIWDS